MSQDDEERTTPRSTPTGRSARLAERLLRSTHAERCPIKHVMGRAIKYYGGSNLNAENSVNAHVHSGRLPLVRVTVLLDGTERLQIVSLDLCNRSRFTLWSDGVVIFGPQQLDSARLFSLRREANRYYPEIDYDAPVISGALAAVEQGDGPPCDQPAAPAAPAPKPPRSLDELGDVEQHIARALLKLIEKRKNDEIGWKEQAELIDLVSAELKPLTFVRSTYFKTRKTLLEWGYVTEKDFGPSRGGSKKTREQRQ